MSKIYTVAEVAKKFDITDEAVCELIRKRRIKAVKTKAPGNPWAITDENLAKYERKMVDRYIKEKLKILAELHIELTWRQLEHLRSRSTMFDVDAYYHDIITGKSRIK